MYYEGILRLSNFQYAVYIYDERPTNYRIDIVNQDLVFEYSPLMPSNVDASYVLYRGKEHYYGNRALIGLVESTMTNARSIIAKPEVTIEKAFADIVVTSRKERDQNVYEKRLRNQKPDYELMKIGTTEIEFKGISETSQFIVPLNLADYRISQLRVSDRLDVAGAEFIPYNQLLVLYPELIELVDKPYFIPESMEQADEFLKRWIEYPTKLKCVDIETSGLSMVRDGEDYLTSCLLGYVDEDDDNKELSILFPFRQENFKYNLPIEYLHKIHEAIENQPKDVKIIAHYGKMEFKGFYKEIGKRLRIDVDTHSLSVSINPLFRSGLHSLKALGEKYLKQFFLELEHIFLSKKNIKFNILPPDIARIYACPDVTTPAKIYKRMMKELPEKMIWSLENIEYPIVKVKAMQEFEGLPIDLQLINDRIKLLSEHLIIVQGLIRDLCELKPDENVNSLLTKQKILYDIMKFTPKHFTKKGVPAVSNEVIKYWLKKTEIPKEDREEVNDIVDLNGNIIIEGKDLARYHEPVLLLMSKNADIVKELGAQRRLIDKSVDGRFMFYINSYGAETTRQTSDAHQFSDEMKKAVIPMSEEHFLWSCDFSQIELRVLPYLAGQTDLVEMEKDPDNDVHRIILGKIQGKEVHEITEEDRKNGKPVNFGIVYGKTPYGLAKDRKGIDYTKEDVLKAESDINDFYNTFSKIKQFNKDRAEDVLSTGYVWTQFGQRRILKDVFLEGLSRSAVASIVRKGQNTPVQGFAAAIMKLAEINLFNAFYKKYGDKTVTVNGKECPLISLTLSIHDEVLINSHKSIPKSELISIIVDCMDIHIKGAPPFFVEPAIVPNWYEGKKSKWAVPIKLRDKIKKAYDDDGTCLIDNTDYLGYINEFKTNEIREYMDSLKTKYGDPEIIAKWIKHPHLTHVLIDAYSTAGSNSTQDDRKLSASINYYKNAPNTEVVEEEREVFDTGKSLFELNKYTYFNSFGEFIEEEVSEDENDYDYEEREEIYYEAVDEDKIRAIFMMNEVMIDLSNVIPKSSTLNKLYAELETAVRDDSGLGYATNVMFADGTIKALSFKSYYRPDVIATIVKKYEERVFVDGTVR